MSTTLWHYTCQHGYLGIGEAGTLLCAAQQLDEAPPLPLDALPLLGMVWATSMREPDRHALGLTSYTSPCDRLLYRYRVQARHFTHWGRARAHLPVPLVDALELAPGAQPRLWWVSFQPVPGARRDHTYRQE